MATYQDTNPQYFPLNIPNNSVKNVSGYYVTVTDTGITTIFRKAKDNLGNFQITNIGEIPKKGNFNTTGNASREEIQFISSNKNKIITEQAIPVLRRGIGEPNNSGNVKVNQILGTNLASTPQYTQDGVPPQIGTDPSGATVVPFSAEELTKITEKQGFYSDTKPLLRYPLNQSSEQYDYMQIQPVEYVAGFNIGRDPTTQVPSVTERIKDTRSYPTIYLPMSSSISETNSVGWGSDELNPIQMTFGQAAANSINAIASNPLSGMREAASNIINAGKEVLGDAQLRNAAAIYFAGQAVSTNFLGRSGIVLNPNLELLFQGPKLRSFRYNYTFTPRDEEEAREIRRIIKVLKKTMAPRKTVGSLFLGVPAVYQIKYIYNGGGEHPFLNKLKPCALTGFNVNYAPDGSYMTYQDGSMTSYAVDMQFDELEPIYNEDISQDLESETMDY
jgi:hypothetical protein